MSIKGTLETFSLRELLQMLAFNQKDGTLVLETEQGPRTVHLGQGRVGYVEGDRHASSMLARVLRRRSLVPEDRLVRAEQITQRTSRFLRTVLEEMGAGDKQDVARAYAEAVTESLFDLQMGKIRRFEFVESRALTPDGREGSPLEPGLPVDGLLLDLTRMMDTWGVMLETVPSLHEVFEGTGHEVDLSRSEEIDGTQAQRIVAQIDGYQDLEQVAQSSAAARYAVLQVAVALLQGGAIRAVPTDDLVARAEDRLARGEAGAALPLLRRALERGDAHPRTRVRMADALEGLGDPIAAAVELDTFANLSEDGQEIDVFDALLRALKLREGDPISAGRVCDHYLRHRTLLKARRGDALDALRTLIHGASSTGRPLEAAQRLACFLQNNEVPGDELMVLADLYAAGGEKAEAASALFRRAEDLIAIQRTSGARDCLRRALEHDASRSDVRRRLQDLEGTDRRAKHRRRVHLLLTLLGLLALGAGGAWWFVSREATRAVSTARDAAEEVVRAAERRAGELAAAFKAAATQAESDAEIPEDLPSRARSLLSAAKELGDGLRQPISDYATRLEESAGGPTAANELVIRGLDQRRYGLLAKAQAAIAEIKRRAETLVADGERANRAGEFERARAHLLGARNLGFEDPTVRERATILLKHVDTYLARCAAAIHEIDAARERGDLEASAQRAFAALADLLDSDGTRKIRIPVALESTPSGAQVLLGGKATDLVTPCVLAYGAFEDTTVVLRLPGRTSTTLRLPAYADVRTRRAELARWSPRVRVDLPAGPRWTLKPEDGRRFIGLWLSGDVPVVLLEDGTTTCPVDARAGTMGACVVSRLPNPVRAGGAFPGGAEWRIMGHRTLRVKNGRGTAWEAQLLGRLERAPVVANGVLAVVDEAGTIYGFQLESGTEIWRHDLGAGPAQAPVATTLGFVASTVTGGATAFATATGAPRNLMAAGHGLSLVAPHNGGVLVIGTGPDGLRAGTAEGGMRPLGASAPRPGCEPYADERGCAWATEAGVMWLARDASTPVLLSGLGQGVTEIAGWGTGLVAVGRDQVLRAVAPGEPDKTLWSTALGGASHARACVGSDAVFVLVNGSLVAVER